MNTVVVDASVAMKWFVPEIHSVFAVRLLESGVALCAPDLILPELANTLWKKARRGEISPEEANDALAAFNKLDVEIVPTASLMRAALLLASSLDRTVYDALYLTLAIARRSVLVTADRKFHSAVRASAVAAHIRWIEEEK